MMKKLIILITILSSTLSLAATGTDLFLEVGQDTEIEAIYSHSGERLSLGHPVNLNDIDGVYFRDGSVFSADEVVNSFENSDSFGNNEFGELRSGGNSGGG